MAAACFCASVSVVVAVVALVAFIAVEELSDTVEVLGLGVTTNYVRVDCAPPPSSGANRSAFLLQDLPPLLAALPAAAAAAPLGFASLQSGRGGAFVRGLCLGVTLDTECVVCLAAAAGNLTGCFVGGSRGGGVWRSGGWRGDGCFVAYSDAKRSSAREDAFRDVVLAGEDPGEGPNCFDPTRLVALAQSLARRPEVKLVGARVDTDAAALVRVDATRKNTVRVFPDVARVPTTVSVLAQCAPDHAAGCARCLADAARRVPHPCSWGLDGAHERVADVLGYSCFLRIETSVPPQVVTKASPNKPVAMAFFVLALLSTIAAAIAMASEAGYLPAVNAAAN